jgi:hypothetical protein
MSEERSSKEKEEKRLIGGVLEEGSGKFFLIRFTNKC